MNDNNVNGNGDVADIEEPEGFRNRLDESNESLSDYEPDINFEPTGHETEFDMPSNLEGVLSSVTIRNIRTKGTKRTSIQISMSSEFRNQWYEFVEVLTGNEITAGRDGASAPMVTIGMRLLMALIAEFEVQNTVSDLRELLGHGGSEKLNSMLKKLLEHA